MHQRNNKKLMLLSLSTKELKSGEAASPPPSPFPPPLLEDAGMISSSLGTVMPAVLCFAFLGSAKESTVCKSSFVTSSLLPRALPQCSIRWFGEGKYRVQVKLCPIVPASSCNTAVFDMRGARERLVRTVSCFALFLALVVVAYDPNFYHGEFADDACCHHPVKHCLACQEGITVQEFCAKPMNEGLHGCISSSRANALAEEISNARDAEKLVLAAAAANASALMNDESLSMVERERRARHAAREQLEGMFGTMSEAKFEKKLQEAAADTFGDALHQCMVNAAGDPRAIHVCHTTVAMESLKSSLGKGDMGQVEVERYLERAVENTVETEMKTCMTKADAISNAVSRAEAQAGCRFNVARQAMEQSMGGTISDANVQQFVRKSAKNSVKKAMQEAMMLNISDVEREQQGRDAAKKALKVSLGVEDVSDTDVQLFLKQGAQDAVVEEMRACITAADRLNDTAAVVRAAKTACTGASAKNALKASLGKDVGDAEVRAFLEQGAKNAAGDAMSRCVKAAEKSNTTTQDMAACKSSSVKLALRSSLGAEVSDVDVERFVQAGARRQATAAMQAAMSINGTASEKQAAAKSAAKEALKLGLGKAEVSDLELNHILIAGARDAVADMMQACVSTAASGSEKNLCASRVAKDALQNSLGKDVTDVEVQSFIHEGAVQSVGKAMRGCSALGSLAETNACKNTFAKTAMAETYGRAVAPAELEEFVRSNAKRATANAMKDAMQINGTVTEKKAAAWIAANKALRENLGKRNVTDMEVRQFVNDGAKDAVGDAMRACMEAAGANGTLITACRGEAQKVLAHSLGEGTVPVEKVEEFIFRGAQDVAMKAMKAASNANSTSSERRLATKKALKQALGKSDMTDTAVQEFVEAGAKSAVKMAMTACSVSAAGNASKLAACRTGPGKAALGSSLGKVLLKDSDIELYVRESALTAVADAMKAAVESDQSDSRRRLAASTLAEKKAAGQEVLADALGVPAVTDVDYAYFKNKGAEMAIQQSMHGCMSAANLMGDPTLQSQQINRCNDGIAKDALKSALGVASVNSADVRKVVVNAGTRSAVDSRACCVRAAEGNASKQSLCVADRTELKESIKVSSGVTAVSDQMAERFVLDGAQTRASATIVACSRTAGQDATKLAACRAQGNNAIAEFLGKSGIGRRRLATIGKGELEEIKIEGATGHVMDKITACYDAQQAQSDKDACSSDATLLQGSAAEAMGNADLSTVDTIRYKTLARVKALQINKAALHEAADMTQQSKEDVWKTDMKTFGIDVDEDRLQLQLLGARAAAATVAKAASACHAAGVSGTACDVMAERVKVSRRLLSHGRSLSPMDIIQFKREGAEMLVETQMMGQHSADGGVLSAPVQPEGYDTLRHGKHFEADIDRAKSRLAGEYLMDCQTAGGTLAACKTAAARRLKDELKSDLPVSDAIVKTQFEVLTAAANCMDVDLVKCETQAVSTASQLDLLQKEMSARKFSAAISSAASAKADCKIAGIAEDSCVTAAKEAFKKLSVGVEKHRRIMEAVGALAKAKENGVVTSMKKIQELTTIAAYNGQCSPATSEHITREVFAGMAALTTTVAGVGGPLKSLLYTSEEKNGKCECVIFTEFGKDTGLEQVDAYAMGFQPTFTVSQRRRLMTVESSTTTTVGEVDPNNAIVPSSSDSSSDSDEGKDYLNSAKSAGSVCVSLWLVVAGTIGYCWA